MSRALSIVGDLLRKQRIDRGMRGIDLGSRVGLSQSKISKMEQGIPPLHETDVENILNVLEAPSSIRQRIMNLLHNMNDENGTDIVYNFNTLPSGLFESSKDTDYVNVLCITVVPLLLETIPYATATSRIAGYDVSKIAKRIRYIQDRQDRLFGGSQRHHILIHETVLYTRITSIDDHLAQLDRIERNLFLQNTRIGVIPSRCGMTSPMACNFTIYGTIRMSKELSNYEIESTDQSEITSYQYLFDDLATKAHYDSRAVAILREAMEHFSSQKAQG